MQLPSNATSEKTIFEQALFFHNNGNVKESEAAYRKLVGMKSQNPSVYLNFASLQYQTGRLQRFNLQKYNAGGHFAHIHSERTDLASLHRLFAFMTYLNDDFEDGHTHFVHQQLKIKPEKGKTLIWPAEWTHAHAGEVVTSGSKYIATGWLLLPH